MYSFRVFLISAVRFIDIDCNNCHSCLFGGIQRNSNLIRCANSQRLLETFHKGMGGTGNWRHYSKGCAYKNAQILGLPFPLTRLRHMTLELAKLKFRRGPPFAWCWLLRALIGDCTFRSWSFLFEGTTGSPFLKLENLCKALWRQLSIHFAIRMDGQAQVKARTGY